MAAVELEQVGKVYPNGYRAVESLDLDIRDGEFLVLVGPSGCGKTTALRLVAGLEELTEGTLRIGDRVVNDVAPRDRDIAMVFQNYALYPHMTVGENIAFGLKLRRTAKKDVKTRVQEAARLLALEEYLDRRPGQLSGGQRQRVAMGRAIVREPQAFLMDEPLSNLDAKLRVQMRAEIARIQHDLGTTTIYVTHDQVEAMTMGDRVAVMKRGVLQQVATPQELYDRPVNLFVGGFIGAPPMNLVQARLQGGVAVVGDQRLALDPELLAERPGLAAYDGRAVALGVRPEDLEDAAVLTGAPADRRLRATVDLVEALGSSLSVHFGVPAAPVTTEDTKDLAQDGDELAALPAFGGDDRTSFVASFSPRSRVRAGDTCEITVDTRRVHVFDLETGAAIWD